ncbi:type I restriction enzyme HsdR N-terminal domain-containing protein [Porphyromonas macacae]|uniref:Type I restriction enzyme R protein N terminus (HSDR_N) n=1 Tax=Porphyromonas macacae TaxID=28115 RepID=A0A379DJZ2_9PORP|nr:type I restriction enzyme HsdR N-terminal domain-containing protein [Porphyromonas macacae]SUB78307.1 Type I restriction enzyme R protein N terminus (HSDR_N) [Porphyromonas macacae]
MFSLNLPDFEVRVRRRSDKVFIYDFLRENYYRLTPEEWVRQHFVHYLVDHLQYPRKLIANELQIKLGNTVKRCDSLVYDNTLKPMALIEYKAPTVTISEKTVRQIMRYNMVLKVPFLFLSNGLEHLAYSIDYDRKGYAALNHIPTYQELLEYKQQ